MLDFDRRATKRLRDCFGLLVGQVDVRNVFDERIEFLWRQARKFVGREIGEILDNGCRVGVRR